MNHFSHRILISVDSICWKIYSAINEKPCLFQSDRWRVRMGEEAGCNCDQWKPFRVVQILAALLAWNCEKGWEGQWPSEGWEVWVGCSRGAGGSMPCQDLLSSPTTMQSLRRVRFPPLSNHTTVISNPAHQHPHEKLDRKMQGFFWNRQYDFGWMQLMNALKLEYMQSAMCVPTVSTLQQQGNDENGRRAVFLSPLNWRLLFSFLNWRLSLYCFPLNWRL